MQIQVHKLRELLELLKPAIPKKTTLPVTKYIKVGEGKAMATDLEVWIIADLPEATEPMLLPYASLADVLKYIPGNGIIKIEGQKKKISLAWDGGTADYPTEDYEEFPPLPALDTRAEGLINGDTLIPAMEAALHYAATENGRPTLMGVTLVLGNPVEVAAGDGFRMAHQTLGLSFPLEEKIIVPWHAVSILEHVFAKTPRTPPSDAVSLIPVIIAKRQIKLTLLKGNSARVDFGRAASVIMRLVDGNPPDFLALIPKGEPILQSGIFAPQFEAAVRRVSSIAKDGSGTIRMVFADGKLTVSATAEERSISATIDTINAHGEPGRVGLNYPYVLDFLSGKQGIITLSQYSEGGPIVFQYQTSPKVLVMPMMVQWGDEKPAEASSEQTAPGDETQTAGEQTAEAGENQVVTEEETGDEQVEAAGDEISVAGEQTVDASEMPATGKKRGRKVKVTT